MKQPLLFVSVTLMLIVFSGSSTDAQKPAAKRPVPPLLSLPRVKFALVMDTAPGKKRSCILDSVMWNESISKSNCRTVVARCSRKMSPRIVGSL